MTRAATLLLFLGAPLFAAPPPVHLRIVEANTSACEWGGEATFTCRQLVPPVALDVAFVPQGDLRVAILVDGERTAELSAPGIVDLGLLAPGAHRIGVQLPGFGRELRIDVVAPRSDAELPPPFVKLATPAAGATLHGDVEVEVLAHNPLGLHRAVDRVELLVDGRLLEARSAEPWSFRWETGASGQGRHLLTARAQGSRGLWSEASAEVVVEVPKSLARVDRLDVVPGAPATVRLEVPAGTRATLRVRLAVGIDAPGHVRGEIRAPGGASEGLFALATPVDPAIPFERDLSAYAGRAVELHVVADGGARATLTALEATSYE